LPDIHIVKLGSIPGLYLDLLGHFSAGIGPVALESAEEDWTSWKTKSYQEWRQLWLSHKRKCFECCMRESCEEVGKE
jgi:hypothetical protein